MGAKVPGEKFVGGGLRHFVPQTTSKPIPSRLLRGGVSSYDSISLYNETGNGLTFHYPEGHWFVNKFLKLTILIK
jgi:hypothetical protein